MGRATSHQRRKEMARAHAKRSYHCTCGKTVHGNGAEFAHKAMHVRKGEWKRDATGAVVNEHGHYWLTYTAWLEQQKLQARTEGES